MRETAQRIDCVVEVRARHAGILWHPRIYISCVEWIIDYTTVSFALSIPPWTIWFAFKTFKRRGPCARITIFVAFQALVCPGVVIKTNFTHAKSHRAIHNFSVWDAGCAEVIFRSCCIFVA